MKYLVIPDIHGRKFWRKLVADNTGNVDKVIFLGDYLDPYQEEIDEDTDSMECNDFYDSYNLLNMLDDIISLKKNDPNKFILLTGNHTDSYIWSKFREATRTDYKNWEQYHKFFSENLNLFNLVWIENDVIFSHAGISQGWANEVWEKLEFPENELCSVKEVAETLRDTPLSKFTKDYINLINNISLWRYGSSQFGSCEWADIREHIDMSESMKQRDFIPIGEDGIYQVFGHTQVSKPVITDKWACLDYKNGFIIDALTHEITKCEVL